MQEKKIWFERNERGEQHEAAGQLNEALALYEENAREGCDISFTYERMAAIYRDQGKVEAEAEALKKAIAIEKGRGPSSKLIRIERKLDNTLQRLERSGPKVRPREEQEPLPYGGSTGTPSRSKGCFAVLTLFLLSAASSLAFWL